jgi:hypothetical protein
LLCQFSAVNRTAVRAKVIHNSVLAVGCLSDSAWCFAGDVDLGAMGDEVVGVGRAAEFAAVETVAETLVGGRWVSG